MPRAVKCYHCQRNGTQELVPIRETLVSGGSRGAIKVYSTDDAKFRVGDIVIFHDLSGHKEVHRVKGHGSLVLDTPLSRDYSAGSEVRTMMGLERVYENCPVSYVGYDHGKQWVASVIRVENEHSDMGTAQTGGSTQVPQPIGVPMFGTENRENTPGVASSSRRPPEHPGSIGAVPAASGPTERSVPGAALLGSSGTNNASGSAGSGALPGTASSQEGRGQARSVSPINTNDEKILGQYFTRGSQGIGEEERAKVLREIEEGTLMFNSTDKEKWTSLESSLPSLPAGTDDEKQQVHIRVAVERWESQLILFYNTISPKAGAYAKAVLA
eukprot:4976564-Amphidinium_carterae.1